MKVLHVTQPVEAGVPAVVHGLVVDQRSRGWSPVVACPPEGWLWNTLRELDIAVEPWPAKRAPGLSTLGETARLARIVRAHRPDAVHLHSSKAGLAGRLAVRGRIPTIFQPHLWSFNADRGITSTAARVWEQAAHRWTDRFLCVSEDESSDGRRAGIGGEFVVVPNGVDVEAIRPRASARMRIELGLGAGPLVVCVARLAPLKGQDLLLEAWPDVLAQIPDATLLFVGDGPFKSQLMRDYPIATHRSVQWLGHRQNPTDYIAASDVVVVPSRAEGMALVPLEAMASARPVVAFAAGGIRQSVADAGVVLEVGDTSGLARELALRLHDAGRRELEGTLGRQRAERYFDEKQAASAIAALVVDLVRVAA